MVDRVDRRADFATLHASPHRARAGALRVTFAPAPDHAGPPGASVGFAISRSVGTAVRRNRLRRRLRELVREREAKGLLPPGLYLLGMQRSADEPSHEQLDEWLGTALRRVEPTATPGDRS